jgi:hypothetical protein
MLRISSCLLLLSLSFAPRASADDAIDPESVLPGLVAFEAVAAVFVPFSLTREDDDFRSWSLTGSGLLALGAGVGVAALAAVYDWPPAIPAAIHLAAWGSTSVLLADLFVDGEIGPLGAISAGIFGAFCFTAGLFTDGNAEAAIALAAPIGLAAYLAFMFLGGIFLFFDADDDLQLALILAAPIATATTVFGASLWILTGEADEPSVSLSPTSISARF